jgi:hypothetical protein
MFYAKGKQRKEKNFMSISFVQPKILIMLSVIIMACKGVCIRHRAQKPIGSFGRYATGQKRCQICEIFIKWNDYGVLVVDIELEQNHVIQSSKKN